MKRDTHLSRLMHINQDRLAICCRVYTDRVRKGQIFDDSIIDNNPYILILKIQLPRIGFPFP